jgi:hypothetical protein
MENRPATCDWTDRCVGLDETASGLVAVLAVRHGRSVAVEPAAGPVEGAALAAGLGEREAWVRRIRTPLKDKAKALGVLPGLLDVQLPFGIEECVFANVALAREPAGWTVTAAGARESEIRARLDRWAAEGREPHHLDQEGLALWSQAFEELPPALEAPRAVVYLGDDRSVLAFGRGAELISTHGLKKFEPVQARRLANLAFDGGAGETDWIWAGPLAEQAAIESHARELGLPKSGRIMKDPRSVLARAYAVRALTSGLLRCDLRRNGLTHPAVRLRRDRRARFSAVVWLAAGLILLASGLAWGGLLRHRLAAVDEAVNRRTRILVRGLDPAAAVLPGYEKRALERAWAARKEELQAYSRAMSPRLSRGLGRLLMTAREEKAVLHRLDWDDAGLRVEGRIASAEAAARLKAAVEREAGFALSLAFDSKTETDGLFVLEGRDGR